MEINVIGNAKKEYVPDMVEIVFTFLQKNKEYDAVVEAGVEAVDGYLKFLVDFGFEKSSCKTSSMRVSESREYNEKIRKYEVTGFEFSQVIKLRFDYDVKKLAEIIEKTSKLKTPPIYTVNFSVKDKKKIEYELYKDAVLDAKNQAEIIAISSGLKLEKCLKVSTNLNERCYDLYSETSFKGERMMSKCAVSDTIQNNFTPENIIVESNLAVVWNAE